MAAGPRMLVAFAVAVIATCAGAATAAALLGEAEPSPVIQALRAGRGLVERGVAAPAEVIDIPSIAEITAASEGT